jgi:hypothetical protein
MFFRVRRTTFYTGINLYRIKEKSPHETWLVFTYNSPKSFMYSTEHYNSTCAVQNTTFVSKHNLLIYL